jgi:hypothetical protein
MHQVKPGVNHQPESDKRQATIGSEQLGGSKLYGSEVMIP